MTGKVLGGIALMMVVLVFLEPTEAAPKRGGFGVQLEKRDWIDEGLDRFYQAVGEEKGVSVPIYGEYGLRLGNSYSDEERAYFVVGLALFCIASLMFLCCCCRCLCRK